MPDVCDFRKPLLAGARYLRVSYWDADWQELDHLSFDGATPMAASIALGQWLEYRVQCKKGAHANDHLFGNVAAVTLEVHDG